MIKPKKCSYLKDESSPHDVGDDEAQAEPDGDVLGGVVVHEVLVVADPEVVVVVVVGLGVQPLPLGAAHPVEPERGRDTANRRGGELPDLT